jgi:pyruvate dehydrogenase E1 component alpha subunit
VRKDWLAEELIAHYRQMLLIRAFEEKLNDLYGEGVIQGTSHFCAGQEATAVGGCAALGPEDLITSTHRGHGHFLAKGGDPRRIMAELFGKAAGYSGGRGGSQHMADFSIGFLGSNGITAGLIPVATGAALSAQVRGTGQVVLCYFGDGAVGQGAFHEAVNMGAIWSLPIVYFCENNGYAMSTPVSYAFRVEHLSQFAQSYGLPGLTINGNDYFRVRSAVQEALDRARAGEGPTLIEAETYRHFGHSKSDDCFYRPEDEESRWAARDPLDHLSAALHERGLLDHECDRRLRAEVAEEVEAAAEFARQAPAPAAETVGEGLWASG